MALLAGVSADYYIRLEQGRDRNPSPQVLMSLSRALRLDNPTTAHLLTLGSARPDGAADNGRTAEVPSTIGQLLRALTLPAFVEDEHFDVLDSNVAAQALSPRIVPGGNRVLTTILDPEERLLFLDWEIIVAELIAGFRASVAGHADDRRTVELVAELAADERFCELWARHDVEAFVDRPPVRVAHPEVGELTLTRDNVLIDERHGLRLVIYHAEPGTDSFDKLQDLPGSRRVPATG